MDASYDVTITVAYQIIVTDDWRTQTRIIEYTAVVHIRNNAVRQIYYYVRKNNFSKSSICFLVSAHFDMTHVNASIIYEHMYTYTGRFTNLTVLHFIHK